MAAELSNIVSPIAKATAAAPSYAEGQPSGLSQDLSGNLRVTGTLTVGGGTISNATSGVATSSTNEGVVSYSYGFNGTTWDQLQVDASKFLKVNVSAGSVTAAGATSNASSGVATGAVSIPTIGYGYGFNGATWDQIQVDANKFLKTAPNASAAAGGVPSIQRLLSAAGTSGDATNVKSTPGRVYWIRGTNVRTSAVYLKLYNSASAPTAGSGTPVDTIYLPPSGSFVFDFPVGVTFSAGIGFTLVTGGADNSSTSVTAGDILALSIGYA